MKNTLIIFVLLFFTLVAVAQQKDFEGIAVYKTGIQSKTDGISDKAWKNLMLLAGTKTIYAKQGNYRNSYGIVDEYSIVKDEKVYIKLRDIDTLYYVDYKDDSSEVISVRKYNEKATVAGFECKLLVIKTTNTTQKFYYAPALYSNPVYTKNYKLGHLDIFSRETESFYLDFAEENNSYILTTTCTSLKQTAVDDSIFRLPVLPRKKFSLVDLIVPPEFSRPEGWHKFMERNIDKELGAKYIRVPKGEKYAEQRVMLRFMINENGKPLNISVTNKKEVHPKLADEAVRVVEASPLWKPARIFGEKTFYWLIMPVVFAVEVQ